jgi:hypothetical protein
MYIPCKFDVIWMWMKSTPMCYPYLHGVLDFSVLLFPENVKHYYQQSHNIHLTNERVTTFFLSSQSSQSVQSSTAIMEQLCNFTVVVWPFNVNIIILKVSDSDQTCFICIISQPWPLGIVHSCFN